VLGLLRGTTGLSFKVVATLSQCSQSSDSTLQRRNSMSEAPAGRHVDAQQNIGGDASRQCLPHHRMKISESAQPARESTQRHHLSQIFL